MGRHKGGNNRNWTADERLKYVLMCEEQHIPINVVAKNEEIPRGTLRGWITRYRSGGVSALNPIKLHPGNRFAALSSSQSLSEEERLRLTIEKLQIENERLKKGYMVKGVGANKEFVILNGKNLK